MLLSIFAGCGKTPETGSTTATENVAATKPEATEPDLTGDETGKQAPMLQEKVDAGTLPHLADRIPVASDVYVEVDNAPAETPLLRRNHADRQRRQVVLWPRHRGASVPSAG